MSTPVPLARPDVVVTAARRVADARREDWQGHRRACARCTFVGPCRVGQWLADESAEADRRLAMAEERGS